MQDREMTDRLAELENDNTGRKAVRRNATVSVHCRFTALLFGPSFSHWR